MAWQLIYTSAPRLLEAGRSGFGTVARHRAIHPILAAALERDSQFDRSAVRGRVVFAHRIVAAGGSRFHVLSCIRETGADYTGRTNHIAHHLIIDPRELSLLGSAAPSPVDICRGMTWRTAWPDAPKWLEASEEISLSQFHPATTPGGAWQAIAGDARYAGVLRPATSSALIIPPETDELALFAESQTAAASQAWQATFTNCIQPTDDLSEFRWVAVEAASPARERAIGGRTVLDLTAPETLPAPPESRSKLFIPTPDAVLPSPSSLAAKSQAKPVGNLFDAQLAAHAPRPRQKRQRKGGLFVYVALAVLLAGAAIYCGMTLFAEAPELAAQRAKVREEVNATFPGTGMETAQTLSKVSKEQLPAALAIARTAREAHEALQKQQLPAINTEEARGQAKAVSLNIPQPVGRIFDLYSTHFESQERLKKLRNSAPEASQLGELESLWKAVDQNTENLADPQTKQLRERAIKSVEALWAERLLAVLKTDASSTGKADWFDTQLKSHLDALSKSNPAHAESDFAKAAKEIIGDWRKVDAAGDDKKELQALKTERRNAWPTWLIAKVEKQIENKPNQFGIPGLPLTGTPKPENVTAESASKPFEGDLIIVTNPTAPEEWTKFAKELAAGNCEIFLGENSKPLSEKKGKYRKSQTEAEAFSSDSGGFREDKAAPAVPYELRLVRAGKTVLTAWVTDGKKPLRSMDGGLVRNGNEIQVQDVLSRSLCKFVQDPKWTITLSSAPWLSEAIDGGAKASIEKLSASMNEEIRKLEVGLQKLRDIRDGKYPEKLDRRIGEMEQYAKEAGFPRPEDDAKIKERYKGEKDKSSRDNALAENERLRKAVPPSPKDPKSLSRFLREASKRGPLSSDSLFNAANAIEKCDSTESKDFKDAVENAIKATTGKISEIDADVRKKLFAEKKAAQAQSNMARTVKEFLDAIHSLPKDRQTEVEKIPGKETEIKNAKNNPLLKPGFLPAGDYTINVKRSPTEQPIPFIRFTIKPQ